MAHKTENQAVGIATALTVHQPVSLGSVGLFAVQGACRFPKQWTPWR